VTVLFAAAAAEAFAELPDPTKRRVANSIELLEQHPKIYPVPRRGLMRGYRYFVAGRHLFDYSLSSEEARITAIIPGAMRRACRARQLKAASKATTPGHAVPEIIIHLDSCHLAPPIRSEP